MKDVVVVDAVRTATGRFGGCFKGRSAVDLGALLIEQCLVRSGLKGEDIDEVIMGMVYQGERGPIRLDRLLFRSVTL